MSGLGTRGGALGVSLGALLHSNCCDEPTLVDDFLDGVDQAVKTRFADSKSFSGIVCSRKAAVNFDGHRPLS
jgi:hypothetical protein